MGLLTDTEGNTLFYVLFIYFSSSQDDKLQYNIDQSEARMADPDQSEAKMTSCNIMGLRLAGEARVCWQPADHN